MAALAKADERGVGVLQFRLAAFHPEVLPLPLKVVDIVARRHDPGVVIGFGIERVKQGFSGGGQGPHGFPVHKPHIVALDGQGIVGHVMVQGVFLAYCPHQPAKLEILGSRAAFVLQQFQGDGPFVLLAAMLAPARKSAVQAASAA